ncbi:MPN575 family protein [Mycoplasmoides pneumoniae]|uniref:MPN575 family protein n=1 Tax=Mycoplasmoides pneumoniae TaxID=2104 RepID=UPI000314F658|nr:hypothetical protein [Mycoplasmoides pneumoniae]ALA30450.1 hypothetical protein C897_03285 [Mycoplasmoides pneumoniae PI 1428]ALA32555.1 hypothetical protein F533_03280 [Mycoplasmoides pneumoniae 51494]ALA33256.1 hypothetical protein F530_03290 [Mycoplasmoides pneumoniae 54089]ALA33960.1 hypothetical protein F531_03285 [Mycoplasmoides pneumoniae 54524]ALA34677.1 hypothetical protein F537_03285 [Mycoplasmoides pneumoniae 85084]
MLQNLALSFPFITRFFQKQMLGSQNSSGKTPGFNEAEGITSNIFQIAGEISLLVILLLIIGFLSCLLGGIFLHKHKYAEVGSPAHAKTKNLFVAFFVVGSLLLLVAVVMLIAFGVLDASLPLPKENNS